MSLWSSPSTARVGQKPFSPGRRAALPGRGGLAHGGDVAVETVRFDTSGARPMGSTTMADLALSHTGHASFLAERARLPPPNDRSWLF